MSEKFFCSSYITVTSSWENCLDMCQNSGKVGTDVLKSGILPF